MVQNNNAGENKPFIATYGRSKVYDQKGAISLDLPALFWQKKDFFYYVSPAGNDDKKQPLSIEKLRSFQGFSMIGDDEALEVIASLDQLSRLLLSCAVSSSNNHENGSTTSSTTICERDESSGSS